VQKLMTRRESSSYKLCKGDAQGDGSAPARKTRSASASQSEGESSVSQLLPPSSTATKDPNFPASFGLILCVLDVVVQVKTTFALLLCILCVLVQVKTAFLALLSIIPFALTTDPIPRCLHMLARLRFDLAHEQPFLNLPYSLCFI